MADPQFEAVGGKADALGAAEAVGQQHRHMACQGSLAPLQHQGQPGIKSIGPKAPQPHLRDFGELAGIFGRPGPLQGELHLAGEGQELLGRPLGQWRQAVEVEGPDFEGPDF